MGPGMPFFLPRGAFVYTRLIEYGRALYERYRSQEVITPQAFSPKLFETSGHLANYSANMYRLWTGDQIEAAGEPELRSALAQQSFALKPMNCPSHCIIFARQRRGYRELRWRVADFGRLHRFERGGVVHGLARVRSFSQDDAHIFCGESQVAEEIEKFIGLLNEVYRALQFDKFDVKLATRPAPDKRLGSDEDWDRSERALAHGLERAGLAYETVPGEGAFYGAKIEFHVHDALKRSWQLGTIQYDPNLPARFGLSFVGEDGRDHRPIMLHRAILGSLERFFAVYLEHCGGKIPTWLAPRQAIVLTVSEKSDEYARRVVERLRGRGLRIDSDLSSDKLGAKVRGARLLRYPYLLVVGPKEAEADSVGVRSRDAGELGAMKVEEVGDRLVAESDPPG